MFEIKNILKCVLVFCAVSLSGCILQNGTEIPNGITGTLYNPDGAPVVNAEVALYPVDYAPLADTPAIVKTVHTDNRGRFGFPGVTSGRYNLLARCATGAGDSVFSFTDSISITEENQKLLVDTLRAPGVITGKVKLQTQYDPRTSTIQLLGTYHHAQVDSAGNFTLKNLGQGTYRLAVTVAAQDYPPFYREARSHSGRTDTLPEPLSSLGIDWTTRNSKLNYGLISVTWTGSQLVAVGYANTILTSSDGVTWTPRNSGMTNVFPLPNLNSVTWTGNQLVIVGSGGIILTSPDGVTWTLQLSGITSDLNSVTWTGSQLVAVGYASPILTSSDGVTWIPHLSPNADATGSAGRYYLYSVTWAGPSTSSGTGQLVAVGGNYDNGYHILTSPDGATWSIQNVGNDITLYSVTWTGNQLVAVGGVSYTTGSTGVILTSTDGVTWAEQDSGLTASLSGVAWTGPGTGQLVAVGYNYNGITDSYTGAILISADGVNWKARSSGTKNMLSSVAWTGTRMVVVGANGIILTSQ